MTRILALDLSLTAAGWAALPDAAQGVIAVKKWDSFPDRLGRICDAIRVKVLTHAPELVVLEGPSYGSNMRGHVDTMGLRAVVLMMLHEMGLPTVELAPASLKMYATGKGNAAKDAVFASAIRRLDFPGTDNNAADAWVLAHLAADALGEPVVALPETHRRAIAKFPEVGL